MGSAEPQGCLAVILSLFGIQARPSEGVSVETRLPPVAIEEPGSIDAGGLPIRLRDDFLSAAEFSFYKVLQQALAGQATICPKVNLADLFFVAGTGNQALRNKFDRKHVDFLICDARTMQPRCGIELDDSSHGRADRQERDELVNQLFDAAGLPLVRFPVRSAYNAAQLAALLAPSLESDQAAQAPSQQPPVQGTPLCEKCGIPMVRREAKRGTNAGQSFYGCPNYPRCKAVVACD